jgi:gamma-glutamyltranspeptidase/glutathione hydrolase
VLAEGGNAVEAAIAVAASIAVVYPHMNSIGGDGFWLIHRPGQPVVAIDACGRAATRPIWRSMPGWRACHAAGLLRPTRWQARFRAGPRRGRSRRGSFLSRLMAEAVAYARDGVSVTAGGAALAAAKSAELRDLPGAYAQIFEPRQAAGRG